MAQSLVTWNSMGADLGETWNFIEVFLHLIAIFLPSSALDFWCNRDKLHDNFEHNSNAHYSSKNCVVRNTYLSSNFLLSSRLFWTVASKTKQRNKKNLILRKWFQSIGIFSNKVHHKPLTSYFAFQIVTSLLGCFKLGLSLPRLLLAFLGLSPRRHEVFIQRRNLNVEPRLSLFLALFKLFKLLCFVCLKM